MKGGLLLDVVVREGAAVLELLAREDQALLVRGDALLVLNLSLHVVDGVRRLHLEGDGLTRDCDDEEVRWEARQCRASVERRGEGAGATLRKNRRALRPSSRDPANASRGRPSGQPGRRDDDDFERGRPLGHPRCHPAAIARRERLAGCGTRSFRSSRARETLKTRRTPKCSDENAGRHREPRRRGASAGRGGGPRALTGLDEDLHLCF